MRSPAELLKEVQEMLTAIDLLSTITWLIGF
jgi:hypothetical protein